MSKLPWIWFDHRSDLPKWLTSELGQITVEWSMLERDMEEVIRLLMDAGIKTGRITTTGMNLRTRVIVATNFLQAYIYDDRIDSKILDDFAKIGTKIVEKTESKRNMVVHGLWAKHEGQWWVLRNSASRAVPMLQPQLKRLARAVLPQREVITCDKLEAITAEIIQASHDVLAMHGRIETALAPLQHKSPVYTRRRRRDRARRKKATPDPPRSSQA